VRVPLPRFDLRRSNGAGSPLSHPLKINYPLGATSAENGDVSFAATRQEFRERAGARQRSKSARRPALSVMLPPASGHAERTTRGQATISYVIYARRHVGSNLWHGSSPPVAVPDACRRGCCFPVRKAGCFRRRERSLRLPAREASRLVILAVPSSSPPARRSPSMADSIFLQILR